MKLVLIRHGESVYNKKNLFTGWADVDLTKKGVHDGVKDALLLKKHGFTFDLAYSSVLKRSIKTLHICLEKMDLMWIPIIKDWRINERHYGALQGLNKNTMRRKFGKLQVRLWRRSYNARPPAVKLSDKSSSLKENNIKHMIKLKLMKRSDVPNTECLADVVKRVKTFYKSEIIPKLKKHKSILISAHGNSMRAFLKFMNDISDDEIVNYEIPFGKPLIFELNNNYKLKKWYYLK